MDAAGHLYVRATVHLQGLPVGERVLVDPSDPYIAELVAAKFLVPDGHRLPPVTEFESGDAAPRQPVNPDVGG